MELTLLEFHLEEPSFTANAPFTGSRSDGGSGRGLGLMGGSEREEKEEESSGGPSPMAFVVGLAFLVGIGLAARRLMRGGSEGMESETEPITA